MGRQIIRQPDGRHALWSTIVDHFLVLDADEKEIADFLVEEEAEKIRDDVHDKILQLAEGRKPYYQFTKSWQEALDTIREVHGQDAVDEITKP